MILTCDSCRVRYLVSPAALGDAGRRVRCSGCGAEWFQAPEEEAPEPENLPFVHDEPEAEAEESVIPESVRPVEEPAEVMTLGRGEDDAAGDKRSVPGRAAGYAAAAAVFLVLAAGLYFGRDALVRVWPPAFGLYETAGVSVRTEGESLVFEGLKAVVEEEGGAPVLRVDGSILNLGKEETGVPPVQISMIDAGGAVIDRWLEDFSGQVVAGGGESAFSASYPQVQAGVKEVNVRFIPRPQVQAIPQAEEPEAAEVDAGHEEGHEEAHEDVHDGAHESAHHEEEGQGGH